MLSKVLFLAAAVGICALPARAQETQDRPSLDEIPHITITGTATEDVKPDIATLTLGVTTQKPSAREAAAETSRRTTALIEAAKKQGVAAADIATQTISLAPTFEDLHDPQGRYIGRKSTGFAADNIVAIRIRDLSRAGSLAQSMIDAGANRFDGIAFSLEHAEPVFDRLTGAAVRRARVQAQIAAEAAGAKLGRVLLVRSPDVGRAGTFRFTSGTDIAPKAAAASPMPVEAGTNTYTQNVEVTFALE